MIVLPLPLLRSMGIGGMLIPVVSVLAALTLLPAMLAVLGPRINSVRVMPQRLIDHGHPEDGAWGRWARFVLRRPVAVAAVGLMIVAVLAGLGTQLNPTEAQLKNFPGTGTAIAGRDQLAAAQHQPRRDEAAQRPRRARRRPRAGRGEAARRARRGRRDRAAGLAAAGRTRSSRRSATIDGAAPGIQAIIDRANAASRGPTAR